MLRSLISVSFVVSVAACLTAPRRFESRIPQATIGSPQLFGPGIETAWPGSLTFVLTRSADVAVVRVWAQDTAQIVYPVPGLSSGFERCYKGRDRLSPSRFGTGWHCLGLALPLDLFAARGRWVDLPDNYLLLIASDTPIDTAQLRQRLDAIGIPPDTGITYVRQLALRLMADTAHGWGAYVVDPCHVPGSANRCHTLTQGFTTR